MARKQPKIQKVEKTGVSSEGPEAEASDARRATITKAAAIRAALKAGIDSPTEGEKYIRDRFGIEVSRTHFSAYKSQEKAKSSGAVDGYLAPPMIEPIGDGDLLDALEKMKPLVASLGADRVKRIVDLLG